MLNRFLGNKKCLLEYIMAEVDDLCDEGDLVCDIFSGSIAVSAELKRHGYRVATNDINYFSYVYSHALIANSCIPESPLEVLLQDEEMANAIDQARLEIEAVSENEGYSFLQSRWHRFRYLRLVALLKHLENCDPPKSIRYRRSHIFDTYCEEGKNSAFVSARGRSGRRRFFSSENAHQLDAILSTLRYWFREQLIEESLLNLVLCVVLDATERVANIQGTYHDFPREFYDPRALNRLKLLPLALDGLIGTRRKHYVGRTEDSLEFIRRVPAHRLLYIDPPYNFRQYTAYYFLPNHLALYPHLDDVDHFFSNVEYVRGQNMANDFASTFCKSSTFIESLRLLIERARTEWVILSYFDGKNHWNDFKLASNGIGYDLMDEFFSSELFEPSSVSVVPICRQNYQSYGGHHAREVEECLFIARKSPNRRLRRGKSARIGRATERSLSIR